jgi:hypothetical protein
VRCAEADGRDVERYLTSALVGGRLRSPPGGFASRGRGTPGSGNRPQFQENAARGVASPPPVDLHLARGARPANYGPEQRHGMRTHDARSTA